MTVLPDLDDPLEEVTKAVFAKFRGMQRIKRQDEFDMADIRQAIAPVLRDLQMEIAKNRRDFIALGQLCTAISQRVDAECDEVEEEAFALNQSEVREFVLKIREIVCE